MIAVSNSGSNFRALAAYLRAGRSGQDVERVAWTSGRNLPTDEIPLAAKVMHELAATNPRARHPVHHIAISFDHNDRVGREAMERVVDRLLKALHLEGHQALLVAHRDREHAHVHVMINRVHPVTHRAWDRWHERVITQTVLRELEQELGLRSIRGRLADLVTERARQSRPRTTARDNRLPLLDRARGHVAEWRAATSWSDLATRLDRLGLWVEQRMRGAVVTDGEHFLRSSQIAPDCSGPALTARFGERMPPPEVPSELTAAIRELLQQYGAAGDIGREASQAASALDAARHRLLVLDAAMTRADEAWHHFDRTLLATFGDPAAAAAARQACLSVAPRTLEREPIGQLAASVDARLALERDLAGALRPALVGRTARAHMESAIRAGTAAVVAEWALERTAVSARAARLGSSPTLPVPTQQAATHEREDAARALREALAALFRDPDCAFERLCAVAAARGGPWAALVLARSLEHLAEVGAGIGAGPSFTGHRESAVTAAQRYLSAANYAEAEHRVTRAEVDAVERAARAAEVRQAAVPSRARTKSALERAIKGLASAEVVALRAAVSLPEWVVVRSIRQSVREVILGRSDVER